MSSWTRTLALLGLLCWSLGCGSVPCDKRSTVEERDTCWFEELSEHAGGGQIESAVERVGRIESPMIRLAAIQRLTVHRY
ncbi:MAG: hypothetical protein QGG40_17300, partial [Myxococcota bacterium]|nr:hypothetical protein [Myxococcota bacterium]